MHIPKVSRPKLNIATTLLNQLITTVCGLVVPHILLTAFGSEAYGITVSITQFLSYISLLESGIGGVARAKLYAPLATHNDREISAVYYAIKHFFQYVAVVFLVYSLGLGIFYRDLAHVTLFSRGYIFALVLVIGISTLAKYMGGLANLTLLVADQRHYVNNFVLSATTILNTLVLVLLTSLKADLILVKLGSSLIFVARPLFYTLYVRKHYHLIRTGEKAALEQKWTGLGQHIAYFLHRNTDIVLLTLFANPRLVSVYSVYSLVISSIRSITEAFSGGMEARFGELIARGELDELRRVYQRYKRLMTMASLVLFGCTGILIVPFVRLYTAGITDADYIQPMFSIILLLAEAVNCLLLPCASLPIAANHLKQTRWGAYGEAAINIALSCILIQWDPLLGVAIGTLIATVFRGAYYVLYASRHILHLPPAGRLLQLLGSAAALCAIAIVGRTLLPYTAIGNYLHWILWGCVIFLILAIPAVLIYRRQTTRETEKTP